MSKAVVPMLCALLLGVGVLAAEDKPADVSGTWTLTTMPREGEHSMGLVIVQDGEKLTVTLKVRAREVNGSGSIHGTSVEWSFTREMPVGTVTSVYHGTVDGDTMSGQFTVMGTTSPWKATRDKVEPSPTS